MTYDIFDNVAPAMPALGRGTECINFLLLKAQKITFNPSFRCFPPQLTLPYCAIRMHYCPIR